VPVAVVDVQVNGSNAVSQLRQINSASRTAETGVSTLRNAVVGLASAIGAVSAAKFVFAKTAELETQTKSLQVLTGSVEQAKQIIQELQQIGAVTPFTSTELIDAAKRLQAFGVEGDRVVEVTQRLADASGATGAELQGIVTAYGQVIAKGRLQGEELLQFQERGIGLQQELQKMYKLSGQELQDALSKGRISADAVQAAFVRLTSTGGKYANGAIAQSDTLSGKLSTLQDGVDQLARRIGQVLTPVLKSIFSQAIAVVDAVNQALAAGRGGGFARSVFGARQALNVGATSQAVDNIAKGIGQVTSQKNKTGIEQNLQALQKYQRLLQSIGPDDPNADRAVQLQGLILEKINQNIAAQKQLNSQTKNQADVFKIPDLTAPTAGKGGKGKTRESRAPELERELGLLRSQSLIQSQIAQAEISKNQSEVIRLNGIQRGVELLHQAAEIQASDIPQAEKKLELAAIEQALNQSKFQTLKELATLDLEQRQLGIERLQDLQDEQELIQARLNGNEAEVILKQQIRDIMEGTKGLAEDDVRLKLESIAADKKRLEEAEQLKQLYSDIGMSIKSGVVEAITSAVEGTKTLGEVASGVLKNIASKLLDVAINFALFGVMSGTGSGGGLLGGLFKRANGGSVMSGQSYLVGEKGPELFTPGRSGSIAPNDALGGGANVTVNVDASGTSAEGDAEQSKKLGKAIGAAVQAELIKQQRPGGLLAR
jgi:tape measure domain-containing protein